MADTSRQRRGPSDATDDSATKAPQPPADAEERHDHPSDPRLIPGGAHGAAADPGMSSLDREQLPGRGRSPRQQDIGSTGDEPV